MLFSIVTELWHWKVDYYTVSWPPRSPDLTPVDFYIWRYMKELVYERPMHTQDYLVRRMVDAAKRVNDPAVLHTVTTRSMLHRVGMCM